MSEVYDINQMSAGEFIDTMVILLEGSGLDRLKFSGDKDFRSVSDLVLLKDIAGEMKAICHFFTKGLNIDEPDLDYRISFYLNLSGSPENYIEKYEYNDISMIPIAEGLLEGLQQRSKKSFPIFSFILAALFNRKIAGKRGD